MRATRKCAASQIRPAGQGLRTAGLRSLYMSLRLMAAISPRVTTEAARGHLCSQSSDESLHAATSTASLYRPELMTYLSKVVELQSRCIRRAQGKR